MKKSMNRYFAVAMALLLVFTSLFSCTAADDDEIITVYVSANGASGNDGLTKETSVDTLDRALEIIGMENEGEIRIVGDVEIKTSVKDSQGRKHVTLTGDDDSARLIYTKTWGIGGDTTVKNIIWRVNANSIYVLAKGHTLEFAKGIVTEKGVNVGCDISIRGGGDTMAIEGDTHVILRSGTFFHIVGGTANRDINGSTNITIYGGVFTSAIHGGNNSYIADSPGQITGNTNIKIIGGDFSKCKSISGSDGSDKAKVLGTKTLDLSEFEGDFPMDIVSNIDSVKLKKEIIKYDIIPTSKYITGYTDGTFNPQGNIKRSEAVAIVSRLIANEEDFKGKYTATYSDVEAGKWYYDNVAFLETSGYLGHFIGNFEPEKYITRAEFVAILKNLGNNSYKMVSFSDVKDTHPLYESIRWAASNGVVTGYPDGTFRPDNTITRAEAVTVINRFIGRSEVTAESYSFTDVAGHWAAGQTEAAAYPEKAGEPSTVENDMKALTKADEYIDYAKKASGTDKALTSIELGSEALHESIKNTKSEYNVADGATVYYVDAENGDDKNEGKSETTAWKTVGRVSREDGTLKPGDVVLFRRGCEWRGQKLWTKPGVTYSAYGEGAKPVLNRSIANVTGAENWEKVEGSDKIYKYTGKVMDCGTLVFDGGEKWASKLLPNFKDGKYMVRDGNGEFDVLKQLTRNLTFVQINYSKVGTSPAISETNCYGDLYLCCENGNPGEVFKSIELTVRDHAIVAMSNVTIDNLRVINAGAHGVSSGNCKNLTVRNCEFEWIGGGIQGHTNGYAVRYGNAIENWGDSENMKVYNNYINQVYDAGITNQYKIGTEDRTEIGFRNSHFYGNIIENTKYPIEIFLTNNSTDATYCIDNMLIENNYFMNIGSGLCESSIDGTTPAGIKCGGSTNPSKNYIIKNNVFCKSSQNLFELNAAKPEWMAILTGNLYVQKQDTYLGTWGGKQYNFDEVANDTIANAVGDKESVLFYVK